MIIRLSTMTTEELEGVHDVLRQAAQILRSVNRHQAAATALAVSREAAQHLLRREADHRQYVARQLSLVPPGAYDDPNA